MLKQDPLDHVVHHVQRGQLLLQPLAHQPHFFDQLVSHPPVIALHQCLHHLCRLNRDVVGGLPLPLGQGEDELGHQQVRGGAVCRSWHS